MKQCKREYNKKQCHCCINKNVSRKTTDVTQRLKLVLLRPTKIMLQCWSFHYKLNIVDRIVYVQRRVARSSKLKLKLNVYFSVYLEEKYYFDNL